MDQSDGRASFAVDTAKMDWEERINPKTGESMYRKKLLVDFDTGVKINMSKWPAGVITPTHIHHCAHGIYVMEGMLKTHNGIYGPGSFVWFAEGDVQEHGATALTEVIGMFITNKSFDIEYL